MEDAREKEQVLQRKVSELVEYLLSSPEMKGMCPLQAETAVVSFIGRNCNDVSVIFGRKKLFPDTDFQSVLAAIKLELKNRTLSAVLPVVKVQIDKIDFSFLCYLYPDRDYDESFIKSSVKIIISELLESADVRKNMDCAYLVLTLGVVGKYIEKSYQKDRNLLSILNASLGQDLEYDCTANCIEFLFLLRNIAFAKETVPDFSEKKVSIFDYLDDYKILDLYINKKAKAVRRKLPFLDSELIELALCSCVNLKENPESAGVAGFISILSDRFKHFRLEQIIDKAAEAPDVSWFGVMKLDAAYYGYDPVMLDSLFSIAGENQW